MNGTTVRAALAAAERGWPVFLLGRSKRPVANCPDCRDGSHEPQDCTCLTCHGFYAATTDPDRIARMVAAVPRGQLAVRTGAPSGLVVVDVDLRHGGIVTFTRHTAAGLLPRTLFVLTGSGGLHLYYRHPGRHVPNSQSGLGPGIDVRADGGYAVMPPSVHPRTGRPYRWAAGCLPIAEMTPALLAACTPVAALPEPGVGAVPARAVGVISRPDRLLAALLDRIDSAPVGRRRVTLYGAARGVARMVAAGAIEHGDAVAVLTDAGRRAGQGERDIRNAVIGAFQAEGVAAA